MSDAQHPRLLYGMVARVLRAEEGECCREQCAQRGVRNNTLPKARTAGASKRGYRKSDTL